MPTCDLEVTNRHFSLRTVRTPQERQVYYYANKNEGGGREEAEAQKINYHLTKMSVKDCKRRLTSLGVAWIDYRKAYDVIPHSSAQKCMEVFGVGVNVRSFVNVSMKKWNKVLTAGS